MPEYLNEQHELQSRVKPGMLKALKDRLVKQIKTKWIEKTTEALQAGNGATTQADVQSGQQLPSESFPARVSSEENVPTRPSTPTEEDGPTCPSTPAKEDEPSTSHIKDYRELLTECFPGDSSPIPEPSIPQPPSPTPNRPSLVLNFRKATPGSPWTVVKPSNKGKGKERASSSDIDQQSPSHQFQVPNTTPLAVPTRQAPSSSTFRSSAAYVTSTPIAPGSSQLRTYNSQTPSQIFTIAGTSSKPFASTTPTSIQTSATPINGFPQPCQWTPAPQPFIPPATVSSVAELKPFSSAPISVSANPTHIAPTLLWEPLPAASYSSVETAPALEVDTTMDESPLEPTAFGFLQPAASSGIPPPPVALSSSWQSLSGSSPVPAYTAPSQMQNASCVGNSPASQSMVFASATPTIADIEMDQGLESQVPVVSDRSPGLKNPSQPTPSLRSQWHIPAHHPQEQSTIPAFSPATPTWGSQPALAYASCSIHCNFGPGCIVLCQHLAPSLLSLISQQAALVRNVNTSTYCSPIPQSQPVLQNIAPPEVPVHRTECGLLPPRPEPPQADILGLSTYTPPPSLPQESAPAEPTSTYEEILAKENEIYLKWQKSLEKQAPVVKGRKIEESVHLDLPKRDPYKLVDFRPKESLSDSEKKCIKILEDQRREAAVQARKAHRGKASSDRTADADSEEATRGQYAKRRKQVQEAEGKLVNMRKQVRGSSRRKGKPRPWGVFGVQHT